MRGSRAASVASVARTFVRAVGELLVTGGVLLLLYVAYTLWWTNIEADRRASAIVSELRDEWRHPVLPAPTGSASPGGPTTATTGSGTSSPSGTRTPTPTAPTPTAGTVAIDQGFALMYIPQLGSSWVSPVVEGIGPGQLARGVGHYPGTARPGDVGNFAVAGHRSTHGEPFANLDRVHAGDRIFVQTRDSYFVYLVSSTEIVPPTKTSVILPVPNQPGVAPSRRLMTLTTCHPRFGSTSRLIVYTHLVATAPAAAGRPAGLPG